MRSIFGKVFIGLLAAALPVVVAPVYARTTVVDKVPVVAAAWIDSRNQQEWRLLATGATWQEAKKICRDAKMRLPRIETLQDAQAQLLSVSAGRKALEVSELAWSADSWGEPLGNKSSAVAMSLRNAENTSVDRENSLPVLCVRDLPAL